MKRTDPKSPMAKRIIQKMEELGFNAKQLSLLAGLNETYVRDLLKADAPNPRLQHVKALARQLKVSVEWLDSGETVEGGAEIIDLWSHKLDREDRERLIQYGKSLLQDNDSA